MLAPHTERVRDDALLALCARSLAEYPPFVAACSPRAASIRIFGSTASQHVAFDDFGFEGMKRRGRSLDAQGVACELLDRGQTLAAAPWLGADTCGQSRDRGVRVTSTTGCWDARWSRRAEAAWSARGARRVHRDRLRRAARARRAHRSRLRRCRRRRQRVRGVGGTARRAFRAPCVPPIEPVKGQMLALAVPAGLVSRATWVPGAYSCPATTDGCWSVRPSSRPGSTSA